MKCYKVLTKNLKSNIVMKQARVQYKVGEYVKAPAYLAEKKYHLLAFSSLKAAIDFSEEGDRIFFAEGKYQIHKLPLRYYWWEVENLARFQRAGSPGLDWTAETIMFKEIKLIEEVNDEML